MGDWEPLFYALGILFLLGIVLPQIVASFIDVTVIEPSPIVENLVDIVNSQVTIPIPFLSDITIVLIDPFNLFGGFLQGFITENILALTVIPNIILIPLLVIAILGIIYSTVALILP